VNVYLSTAHPKLTLAAVVTLERYGHRVTSTWDDGTRGDRWLDDARLHAIVSAQEIRDADAALFVGFDGAGAWLIDVGVALGARKPVIFVTCLYLCVMFCHPGVERAASVEDAALMLADVYAP